MTGVHPARHGIFDFLARDVRSYLPFLSSSAIEPAKRSLAIGKFQVPLGRPRLRLFRKAPPFWKILGEHGIFCSVVRVPATFPAERFHGTCLSGMSVPDLRGTQGSFTYFTERPEHAETTGGLHVRLRREGRRLVGAIPGPEHPLRPGDTLEIPLTVELRDGEAELTIADRALRLAPGKYSEWIPLTFGTGLGVKPRGIVRFRLSSLEPFGLYMTPIHIDPERPALPISHPGYYASYLAKLLGPFATLGLAEDTWALNERALDEDGFLEQAYLFQEERERQLLRRARQDPNRHRGLRLRRDRPHPAHVLSLHRPRPSRRPPGDRDPLRARDRGDLPSIGRPDRDACGPSSIRQTVLLVLSDHGFSSFRRGVNLNAWLLREGYLALREGTRGDSEYLRDVDWSRTRAYAVGLAGLYLNLRGREAQGIVTPSAEAELLKREIAVKLEGLQDPEGDRRMIAEAVDMARRYRGPYLDQSPDLIVGYADGYRVSWDAAIGKVAGEVVSDNAKCWSGDHCVDPRLVPGVLFCNRQIPAETPSIVDVAPTILELYGMPPPAHMEGRSLGVSLDA